MQGHEALQGNRMEQKCIEIEYKLHERHAEASTCWAMHELGRSRGGSTRVLCTKVLYKVEGQSRWGRALNGLGGPACRVAYEGGLLMSLAWR